jgi:hypothetical protein
MNLAPLTVKQRTILSEFYTATNHEIVVKKSDRTKIWDDFVVNRKTNQYSYLEEMVPAFFLELNKALTNGKNLQSAVFSECVYAQSLAENFLLSNFTNLLESKETSLKENTIQTIKQTGMAVRYCYSNSEETKLLLQAGSAKSVDCAWISKNGESATMIEFKEQYARTSEPDLPKYGEDGKLISSEKFDNKYPQFRQMLAEQIDKGLNVFEHLGSNEHKFSTESILFAVLNNYNGNKFADVICTEDNSGFLVMLPTQHVAHWARLEGEIRPSGRNKYKVWTPKHLLKCLQEKDAVIENGSVTIPLHEIEITTERGGSKTNRCKINPLYFVRFKDAYVSKQSVTFKLQSVWQLNPSISTKMNFMGIKFDEVKKFYLEILKK